MYFHVSFYAYFKLSYVEVGIGSAPQGMKQEIESLEPPAGARNRRKQRDVVKVTRSKNYEIKRMKNEEIAQFQSSFATTKIYYVKNGSDMKQLVNKTEKKSQKNKYDNRINIRKKTCISNDFEKKVWM